MEHTAHDLRQRVYPISALILETALTMGMSDTFVRKLIVQETNISAPLLSMLEKAQIGKDYHNLSRNTEIRLTNFFKAHLKREIVLRGQMIIDYEKIA